MNIVPGCTRCIVLVFLVLAAGCAGTVQDRSIPTTPEAVSSPVVLPLPSPDIVPRYIQIYPPRDIRAGERLTLRGITSIPEGEPVGIELYSDESKTNDSRILGMSFSLNRTGLSEGLWEEELDTSQIPAGHYFINIFRDHDGQVRTSGEFRVLDREELWLTIYQWDDLEMGITYRIYGDTNLPAGDRVQVNITEYAADPSSRDNTSWIYTSNAIVEHVQIANNFWACVFTIIPPVHPGNYTLSACSVNYPGVCSVTAIPVVPARPRPSTSSLVGAGDRS